MIEAWKEHRGYDKALFMNEDQCMGFKSLQILYFLQESLKLFTFALEHQIVNRYITEDSNLGLCLVNGCSSYIYYRTWSYISLHYY